MYDSILSNILAFYMTFYLAFCLPYIQTCYIYSPERLVASAEITKCLYIIVYLG